MKNAPFVRWRFKSGLLAMFSPLASAITEVGKEIVKPEEVAVTAAVAPIVLALIGKSVKNSAITQQTNSMSPR